MEGNAALAAGVRLCHCRKGAEAVPVGANSSPGASCGKWHLLKYNKCSKLQMRFND